MDFLPPRIASSACDTHSDRGLWSNHGTPDRAVILTQAPEFQCFTSRHGHYKGRGYRTWYSVESSNRWFCLLAPDFGVIAIHVLLFLDCASAAVVIHDAKRGLPSPPARLLLCSKGACRGLYLYGRSSRTRRWRYAVSLASESCAYSARRRT